jgi:hypothetical protein
MALFDRGFLKLCKVPRAIADNSSLLSVIAYNLSGFRYIFSQGV